MRLSYDKWELAKPDFLIRTADKYEGIVISDVKVLKQVLDGADKDVLNVMTHLCCF